MSSSCQHTLEDLTRCLRESDCMQARMHSLRSTQSSFAVISPLDRTCPPVLATRLPLRIQATLCCLSFNKSTVPGTQKEGKDIRVCAKEVEACAGLRAAYFQCKRGQIDARNRIIGNRYQ